MTAPRTGSAPRLAVLAGLLAPTTLAVAIAVGDTLQPTGYRPADRSMIELAAAGSAYRWLLVGATAIAGLAVIVVAGTIPGLIRRARSILAAGGLATIALALVPAPGGGQFSAAHLAIAILAAGALALWPWFGIRVGAAPTFRPVVVRVIAPVLLGLVVTLPLTARFGLGYGRQERIAALALLAWPAICAVAAWWHAGHRLGSRHAGSALAGAAVLICCALGGAFSTVLVPASTETANFRVAVSLSPNPWDAGLIRTTTALGDIDVRFRGPAPGLVVSPQVRATITEALARPNMSLSALQPTEAEIDRAIRSLAGGLALRFGVGAVIVVILALLARILWRRRVPDRTFVLACLVAGTMAIGATGAAVAQTYRVGKQSSVTSTGLLGAVADRAAILDDLEARSAQVAPYVANVIALASALQGRYDPGGEPSSTALRVLLVSDIHSANQYALMRTIISDADIDLVIDAGDLLNFGSVLEGEIFGVFAGIASLPVPYLFVRGNHDATGPEDQNVLNRLAQIPNVVLLQPSPSQYTVVTAAGLTIAGFNDPRWFGDDGRGSPAKQQPAREAFVAAFADRPEVDLVVSHEPWAVIGLPRAGVVLNGHMHSSFREGNRVQVGTFTGGGSLSHYQAGSDEELVGQPSTFDVLAFGSDCRLSSVTRYRFTDVVEGRPAYDEVSLVNGATIDTRADDPERRCDASEPMQQTSVPAVPSG